MSLGRPSSDRAGKAQARASRSIAVDSHAQHTYHRKQNNYHNHSKRRYDNHNNHRGGYKEDSRRERSRSRSPYRRRELSASGREFERQHKNREIGFRGAFQQQVSKKREEHRGKRQGRDFESKHRSRQDREHSSRSRHEYRGSKSLRESERRSQASPAQRASHKDLRRDPRLSGADNEEHDANVLLLDEQLIWHNLEQLNWLSLPRINQWQLYTVLEHVLDNVRHLISFPISEVGPEYSEVVARVLATSKQKIWHGFGPLPANPVTPFTETLVITQSDTESIFTGTSDGFLTPRKINRAMSAPNLGQFLVAINGFIQVRNEVQFTDYLMLEPPFGPQYQQMIAELKQVFPKGSEEALEKKCEQSLPQAVEGADQASWSAFVRFMACYLAYLRDVDSDPNKYLETYDLLSELQKHANAALGHGSLGYLMLQTTIKTAKLVCRLAIGLDKRPDLIRHLKGNAARGMGDGEEGQETLPERAANSLRGAFNTCLADRSTAVGGLKDGRPEGKKQGIYIFANLCLKILFQCKKTRNAANLFEQIENSAPPLAAYPKSQRVTYLYYLGRYWFQNNHFHRAQAALEKAYQESPSLPVCTKQRRHVLVYLIASNIVLGRFPSQALLAQPEAAGLQEHFLPLCLAIRQGNLNLFKSHMYHNSANVEWMLYWRILLQLRSKCEVLVWRSLIRKTFILAGRQPDPASKIAPTVDVDAILATYTALVQTDQANKAPFDNPPDRDFDLEDVHEEESTFLPSSYTVESILSSLVTQGFLGGYVSHKQLKFAITGAARKGVMAAGFPQPWEVMTRKVGVSDSDHVPGWKEESTFAVGGLNGGPRVIRMSGAKAAGT